MKERKKYFLTVSLTILIVCCFEKAKSFTTTSSPETSNVPTTKPLLTTSQTTSAVLTTEIPWTTPWTTDDGSCGSLGYVNNIGSYVHSNWYIRHSSSTWHNMSFWGGHIQIPWTDNLDNNCEYYNSSRSYFLALTEKHKEIADIGEDIMTVDACLYNLTGDCIWTVQVEMRKCDGHLLYRFPWTNNQTHNGYYYSTYICFDKVYRETCETSGYVYTAGNANGNLLDLQYGDIQHGWFDANRDGKQYVLPSFEDVEEVFEKYNHYNYGLFLREAMAQDIDEVPVRLGLCYVYYYGNYDYYNENEEDYYYSDTCDSYVYARKCHGKMQFDVRLFYNWRGFTCFIHYSNVKVLPEIGHIEEIRNDGTTIYSPFLQFRCSSETAGTATYRVNWYINGTLWMETGPSSEAEDLVFKGESLNNLRLGYQVKCGVITTGTNGSSETFSDDFYAGWQISDTSVKLSKNGSAIVEVEQTVPLGCAYSETGQENCEEILSLIDPNYDPDSACTAGIHVLNADDKQLSYHKIKSLKLGEKWDASIKYRFRLSTIDHDYDDKLHFDMSLMVTKTTGHMPQVDTVNETELISTVKVVVTNSTLHRNKRCYSHADPHMRTADGRYYGQQREGDHMLYRNKAYQSEVHEYARYCNEGYNYGPVCACGVAVRSGADVFMINRCGNFTVLDFLQCGDGGILDVEPIHGYRYKVTTPIGTIVIINLHSWGKTMDIDIYLSAKDFGNIDGLCGYFDGNNTNDFRHRDGTQSTVSSGYYYYEFSDSWRLLDTENFLKNGNRSLEPWDENNGGAVSHPCYKPNSITKNKCQVEKRKKREAIVRFGKVTTPEFMPNAENTRERRRTAHDITDEKARALCNSSINEAPAVREFSDKLAGENTEVVLTQCVYDIVHGNNTVWAEAHANALNNIATAVISLNPVFASNNSESVKSFLSQTCLNNCSGHGECSDTGLCTCEGIFRGPDCRIDLRTPPIIYDIQDGGVCDTADDNECDCFVIRTDNIFEGFAYEISTYELFFDSTRKQVGQSVHTGEYEDIFTGVCCVPEQRKKRSADDSPDPFLLMFDFVISNDGSHFGQSKSVYVYDSTCVTFDLSDGVTDIVVKGDYCYIGGACVEQRSTLQTTSGCYVCEPKSTPYGWTRVTCGEDDIGLSTAALIGIIAGSVSAGIILTMIIVYVRCFKGSKKRRTVEDIQSSQTYLSPGPARETLGHKFSRPMTE